MKDKSHAESACKAYSFDTIHVVSHETPRATLFIQGNGIIACEKEAEDFLQVFQLSDEQMRHIGRFLIATAAGKKSMDGLK